jgi:hypothetical protein
MRRGKGEEIGVGKQEFREAEREATMRGGCSDVC